MTRVAPKKSLGQHFLVDRNVLGVIERLAHPTADDVVLEIGPGLGILTTFLADRVRHVHAVELDRSLEQPLREALGDRTNVDLHLMDALALDVNALEPPPGSSSQTSRTTSRRPSSPRRSWARRRSTRGA